MGFSKEVRGNKKQQQKNLIIFGCQEEMEELSAAKNRVASNSKEELLQPYTPRVHSIQVLWSCRKKGKGIYKRTLLRRFNKPP